jgi:hypothetical protein
VSIKTEKCRESAERGRSAGHILPRESNDPPQIPITSLENDANAAREPRTTAPLVILSQTQSNQFLHALARENQSEIERNQLTHSQLQRQTSSKTKTSLEIGVLSCFLGKLLVLFLVGFAWIPSATAQTSPDKVLSTQDFGDIRREVETLRGKKFLRAVPVYKISEKELRAIYTRELDKDFPGPKLHSYEELLAWLDMVPPHTDLKAVYADFYAASVEGLYDSDTKEMCIPSFPGNAPTPAKKAGENKLISSQIDGIVLAHEFTHNAAVRIMPHRGRFPAIIAVFEQIVAA